MSTVTSTSESTTDSSLWDTVSLDARDSSFKALYVVFIIAIVTSSITALIVILQKGSPLLINQRKFIIFTLIVGDLLLALFSLTVEARKMFEPNVILSTATRIFAEKYQFHFLPFVFSTGMIVLALELRFRGWIREKITNPYVASLCIAGAPWILGLLVVMPLVMEGFNWFTGTYDSIFADNNHQTAWCVVSNIIPTIIALITCITVSCLNFPWFPQHFEPPTLSTHSDIDDTASQLPVTEMYHVGNQPPFYLPGHIHHAPSVASTAGSRSLYHNDFRPSSRPNSGHLGAAMGVFQPPSRPHSYRDSRPDSYRDSRPESYRDTSMRTYLPSTTRSHPDVFRGKRKGQGRVVKNDPNDPRYQLRREKRDLLVVTLTCVGLTLPWACFRVVHTLNEKVTKLDPIPKEILEDWFLFFLYMRSIITPIIWTVSIRKP